MVLRSAQITKPAGEPLLLYQKHFRTAGCIRIMSRTITSDVISAPYAIPYPYA